VAQRGGRNRYRKALIAELDVLFPPQLFRAVARHGNEDWTPRTVLWVSLIMFWLAGKTLDEQFSQARRIVKFLRPHGNVPVSYSGFVAAQIRHGPLVGRIVIPRLRPDESWGSSWRVLGWLLLAVDGTRFECPRTASNERGLGCAGREKTAPQVFHTLLKHVGTGLPWDFRLGPGTDSERRHLLEMLAELPENTLLTADAGFVSYALCLLLTEAKCRFVMRIGANKTLIENLHEDETRENIVFLWPEKDQASPPLKLRRICFRSKSGLPVVLVTNILDADVLNDLDAQELYKSRWGIEVYFRHLKQTFDFKTLLSRTPATAKNEQAWRFVSFWTLQRIFIGHQIAAGQNPRRFSPAQARREIREVLQLMQLDQSGPSLAKRSLSSQIDTYHRKGPKTTRAWARKKNDQPPKPPKTRPATEKEIQKAKQLGFKVLLI
jgi:hypothetical protein